MFRLMATTEAHARILDTLWDALPDQRKLRTIEAHVYESPDDPMEFEVVVVAPIERHRAIFPIVRRALRPYSVNFVTLMRS